MMDCLFIGSATKDILMQVESPPASDQRLAATNVTFACGGIASVAASAFQKLGGAAGLISAVGRPSDVTDFIRADLEARNLAFPLRSRRSAPFRWNGTADAASRTLADASGSSPWSSSTRRRWAVRK